MDSALPGDSAVTLEDARADFLLSRHISGCTPKTLEYYATGLDALGRFCAAAGVAGVERVSPTLLRAFVGHLLDRPDLRPVSARTYWRAVRAFARWCHAEGLLPTDPTAKVGRLKVDAPAPKTVAPADVEALRGAWSPTTFLGARNRLLVLLLFDSGCRLSEALSLRLGDLDLAGGAATVMGKARRARLVPLGRTLCAETERFLRRRATYLQEHGRADPGLLLPDAQGGPWSVRAAGRTLERARAGLGLAVSAHRLRHSFAHEWVTAGGDAFSLQRLLGHTDLTMTRRYCDLWDRDALDKHRALSPGDRLAAGRPERGGRP